MIPSSRRRSACRRRGGERVNLSVLQATIGNVGPTPVLLMFADHDAAFPTAEHHGADPDVVTPEIAMWRNGCNVRNADRCFYGLRSE